MMEITAQGPLDCDTAPHAIIQQSYFNPFFTVRELHSMERSVFACPISSQAQDTFFGRKSK